jgi:hypothetical protein
MRIAAIVAFFLIAANTYALAAGHQYMASSRTCRCHGPVRSTFEEARRDAIELTNLTSPGCAFVITVDAGAQITMITLNEADVRVKVYAERLRRAESSGSIPAAKLKFSFSPASNTAALFIGAFAARF